MNAPLIRYPLDPTGTNANNFVNGEVKTLATTQIRAVAPAYGPFFTESIAVFDHGNGRTLVHGDDYRIVDLLQTATLRFGKEIAQVVLITNPNVGSQVRLNYQVLGGEFQNNAEGLVNLYDSIMADGRPVDWSEVLNKPTEYTPTLHTHLLQDLYGFEPVVTALERVRNAIVLSDVPAFETLIEWVKASAGNMVVTDPMLPFIEAGKEQVINVFTTNNPNTQKYFWSVEHITTSDINFVVKEGNFQMFQNRSSFTLKMAPTAPPHNKKFSIIIRRDRVDGPIATTIDDVTFMQSSQGIDTVIELINTCCFMEPRLTRNAMAFFITGE